MHAPTLRASVPSVVEIVLGDLGDPAAVDRAVAGTEIVYHLGAAMSGNAGAMQRGTAVGTRNIVESTLTHRVPKLVYVSSLSVLQSIGVQPGARTEDDWPLEPHPERRGAYTQTKLEAERLVALAAQKRGLNAVILRPGQVWGDTASLLTPAVGIRAGKRLFLIGSGDTPLPLVHVEDLVTALIAAGQSPAGMGETFHIVDDDRISRNEVAAIHARTREPHLRIIHVPLGLACAAAWGVAQVCRLLGRAAPLSAYRLRAAVAPLPGDCSQAREQLGWEPQVRTASALRRSFP